jgi:hypothetical protein
MNYIMIGRNLCAPLRSNQLSTVKTNASDATIQIDAFPKFGEILLDRILIISTTHVAARRQAFSIEVTRH